MDAKTKDHGPHPFTVDIEQATLENQHYRATLWTGQNLQLTVMSIEPGHDVGLEVHEDHDQFLRIEAGRARVQMGPRKDDLSYDREVKDDWMPGHGRPRRYHGARHALHPRLSDGDAHGAGLQEPGTAVHGGDG